MNILVYGSGAREQAVADVLQQSPNVKTTVSTNLTNLNLYDFIVIGPEQPLAYGIVDQLNPIIPTFGPTQKQAQLESSKLYAKKIMHQLNIPTPNYKYYAQIPSLYSHYSNYVIKQNGLAKGKGVVLPKSEEEAIETMNLFHGDFIIEDRLIGEEVSIIAFCNGNEAFLMPQAQDYKQTYNGKNTGGMGAYAPASILSQQEEEIVAGWLTKVVQHLGYKGFLYAGLMKTINSIYILEFNCRLGDPEAQVLLNLLETPLIDILIDCYHGRVPNIKWKTGYCSTVVLSHLDYPGSKLTNPIHITGLNKLDQRVKLYYGNVIENTTTGGRILSVVSYAPTLFEATNNVYDNIRHIELSDKKRYYRTDIGLKQILDQSKRKIKIAILGSTNGTSAEALINYSKSNAHVSVEVICSNRANAGIMELAKKYKIDYCYLKKKGDDFLCNMLKLYDVDYIFLVGYMKIINPVLVDRYVNRIINVHPSLLPRFAGGMDLDVHQAVIDAGESVTGCTVHYVTNEVDAGPIIVQRECIIDTQDAIILKQKVQALESLALIDVVNILSQSKVTYESSGVSIERGDNVVKSLENDIKDLDRFCSIRGDWAFSTDGVGTKIELCAKYSNLNLYNAGIDLVAMSVNDLICHGAFPQYFMDYIAVERIDSNVDILLEGIKEGCRQAGCDLIGGETAEMRPVYRVNGIDAAGFCAGKIQYKLSNDVKPGDYIMGLPSSGLHSNGFSLIREIYKNETEVDWDTLLHPTKIYVNEIRDLLENHDIKAIANITGGGIMKNLPRITNNLSFELFEWEFSDIFVQIQNKTKQSREEMLSTFNCGVGMVIISAEPIAGLMLVGKISS